jgi:thioredoxin reductase
MLSIRHCLSTLGFMNLAETSTYDVAVIGGGAAGLSAALVLSRARRRVVVIDAGQPRNAPASHMQGYLSRDGMPPKDLLAAGRNEVADYGCALIDAVVTDISRVDPSLFRLALDNGPNMLARRVLVTTGLRDELPQISGLRERWGRDLLHCPYCHGYEVRNGAVGVLGGTPGSVAFALLVRQWADDIIYFPHTAEPSNAEREQLQARGIRVETGTVARLLVEDDELRGIAFDDGREVRRTAVFVRPIFVPNNDLLVRAGAPVDETGWVIAEASGATSQPGLYVAGNVANPRAQVITAAGEGSTVAIAINADLVEEDVTQAVDNFRTASTSQPTNGL